MNDDGILDIIASDQQNGRDDLLLLIGETGTGIYSENESTDLKNFTLHQNYPNPFNPVTKIKYSVLDKSLIKIKVYDILGREIETLVNQVKVKGIYEIDFRSNYLPSGIYFYRMEAGSFNETKKMMLIK